jgi:hypothetical protein
LFWCGKESRLNAANSVAMLQQLVSGISIPQERSLRYRHD